MKVTLFVLFVYSFALSAQTVKEKKIPTKSDGVDSKILYLDDPKGIDTLFKNMIVVQKKAIERKGKFVFDTHMSFDFSDNPKTMYAASLGVGYAFSESFEFGLTFAPYILSQERSTVIAVKKLVLENGDRADLAASDPKWEAGGSLIWIFAYGKDAFGAYSIIRSDTFLKLFVTKIQYLDNSPGGRMGLLLGKTFFISNALNIRISAGIARHTSSINEKTQTTNTGIIEPGLVWFY